MQCGACLGPCVPPGVEGFPAEETHSAGPAKGDGIHRHGESFPGHGGVRLGATGLAGAGGASPCPRLSEPRPHTGAQYSPHCPQCPPLGTVLGMIEGPGQCWGTQRIIQGLAEKKGRMGKPQPFPPAVPWSPQKDLRCGRGGGTVVVQHPGPQGHVPGWGRGCLAGSGRRASGPSWDGAPPAPWSIFRAMGSPLALGGPRLASPLHTGRRAKCERQEVSVRVPVGVCGRREGQALGGQCRQRAGPPPGTCPASVLPRSLHAAGLH